MTYLEDIGSWTQGEIARRRETRSLGAALAPEGVSVIAEFKRASPSEGAIAPNANPIAVAKAYEAGGAAAISVLTCERDFNGSLADLEAVRRAVDVPLLAKDFFIDPWQIVEARTHGADAILLILAMVTDDLAAELIQAAEDHDMDVLAEVHDDAELARALQLGCPIIGVNARNLHTLAVDPASGRRLMGSIPTGFLKVAESGVASGADVRAAAAAGADAALVGTALMRNPGLLEELVGN